jgi:hypothetical protein
MEMIDDIVREMRAIGRLDEKSTDKIPRSHQALGLRTYADRIEEAVRNCNRFKIRKALERLREWGLMDLNENAFIADSSGNYMKLIKGIIEIANDALSAPLRNCDVGTAEEQGERCLAQFDKWRQNGEGKKLIVAIMEWSQMPYEKGATDE